MGALDIYYDRAGIVVEHMALALEQVPEDKAHWKPCEKALPWMHLLSHNAIHRILFMQCVKGEPVDFPGAYRDPALQPETPKERAAMVRRVWAELVSFLKSKPEDFAKARVTPFWGGQELTVEEFLWWMYEENVHHRGQAWIYARMNGIRPPAIWGTERP
ncbi:MAG: DinB family protein [Nitrospinae bacterium]|nr:DinB family protein [Nitrospinota bacterium]